jgi:hypothetical protein
VVVQRRMKPSDFHHVNAKIFENRQFLREIKVHPVLKLLGQLTNSFLKPPTNNLQCSPPCAKFMCGRCANIAFYGMGKTLYDSQQVVKELQ